MNEHRKQVGSLIVGQAGALALSFVLPLILTRVLSVGDYGVYTQFNMLASVGIGVLALSASSQLYFFLPGAERGRRTTILIQTLILLTGTSVLSIGIMYLPFVRDYVNHQDSFDSILYLCLALTIAFSLFEFMTTDLYVIDHDNRLSAVYLPARTVFRVGLMLISYVIWPTVLSILLALTASALAKLIFAVVYTLRKVRKSGRFRLDRTLLREQFRYSLPLGLSQALRTLSGFIDKIILLWFITPAEYAVYSIAFYGVPGLMQVYVAISQSYVPLMVTAYKEEGKEKVIEIYRGMVGKTLGYSIPVLAIFAASAPQFVVAFFTDKYIGAVPYFQIYLLTFIFTCLGAGNMLRAIGKTRFQLIAFGCSVVLMIPVTYLAIRFHGMNGAIVCSVVSMALPLAILTFMDAHEIGVRITRLFPWRLLGKVVVCAAAGALVAGALASLIPAGATKWWVVLTAGISIVAAYGLEILLDCFMIPKKEIMAKLKQYLPI